MAHDHHAHADWDDEAERYNELMDAIEPELSKATAALLHAAHVEPGKRVLDVACGPGHTTGAATRIGADATGLDSSPEMLRHARERFPDSRFILGDMLRPPPGPWDAIVCRLGGHHADLAWITAAAQVLAPGGWLAIAETDALDESAREKNMKRPMEWIRIMTDAGLQGFTATRTLADFDNIPASVWGDGSGEHDPPKGPIYVIAGRKPEGAA